MTMCLSVLPPIGNTLAVNWFPALFSSSAGSWRWCSASSYARRAVILSTTSASCIWPFVSIAKRDTAAPGGSVIWNVPSRVRGWSLWKYRCSSVNASGPSKTALASTRARIRPLPSDAVSDHGASIAARDCW